MITQIEGVDGLLLSVSLFNVLLMIWLGLTVILNAERRDWGVRWVMVGFMSGALFFICHTIIVAHELGLIGYDTIEGWWRFGWYPVVVAPLVWYMVVLWYVGYWEQASPRMHRWHRPMVWLLTAYTLFLVALLTFSQPLPSYKNLASLDFSGANTIAGTPVLLLLYPPFGWICILLSWDALRHPAPSQRIMGDLARQRARPWLLGTASLLLLVVTLVAGFVLWLVLQAPTSDAPNPDAVRFVVYFDLLLETLIALAIMSLGQAIVSYEIFTGQILPRRGFFRQWRGSVLFAWGTACVAGFALTWRINPIFSFLLTTVIMIILYAFFGWRSFKHREELLAHLRPLIVTANTDSLPDESRGDLEGQALFTAICQDILETTQAYLIPLGTRAPLVGSPLTYPSSSAPPTFPITGEIFAGPDTIIIALDPRQYAGTVWGIPLWAGPGLIGALLLGPKRTNAVYTREEIEIARTSTERILDMLAREQITQRLVQIQRRRLAETKVLDMRTRRTLHDDILPELHMVALQLSACAGHDPTVSSAIQTLTQIHHQISDLIHTSTGIFTGQPALHFVQVLRDMIEEEYADAFDSVSWQIPPEPLELDPLLYEVVLNAVREAVRNAALHGRGNQPNRTLNLTIKIYRDPTHLRIEVQDDGVGMVFGSRYGNTTAGSGSGLMLHSTMLNIAGGELGIETPSIGGTRIIISCSLTKAYSEH